MLVCDPSDGATYDDLDAAFRAVRAGAELVARRSRGARLIHIAEALSA